MEPHTPSVGVGVMIVKEGAVLLGQRRGSHGDGEFAFPGGHLEYLESFEHCAKRETLEECGIEIGNIRFQFIANVTNYAPKHYVHIGLLADWQRGTPERLEPASSGPWAWYDIAHLPHPLFEMCRLAIDSYQTQRHYYDG
jgi:8-oxo-dGTP diphosphatase